MFLKEYKNQENINIYHEMLDELDEIKCVINNIKHFKNILIPCYEDCIISLNNMYYEQL